MKTLRQVMPKEFMQDAGPAALKFADVAVLHERYAHGFNDPYEGKPWPGPHRFVYFWVELENGYIVGWNENPSRGWSFPVMPPLLKKD